MISCIAPKTISDHGVGKKLNLRPVKYTSTITIYIYGDIVKEALLSQTNLD